MYDTYILQLEYSIQYIIYKLHMAMQNMPGNIVVRNHYINNVELDI